MTDEYYINSVYSGYSSSDIGYVDVYSYYDGDTGYGYYEVDLV